MCLDQALVDSRNLEEKVVRESVQPIETIAEHQPQNTQETNKFFKKPSVEFREVYVKEKNASTKDWVETIFFGDFGASQKAR